MDILCKFCGSENVYFSKKKQCYHCEDCEKSFTDNTLKSQRIFLSYGHDENAVVVNSLKEILKKRGHNPWLDLSEIKAGYDWRIKITEGIQSSQHFFAFTSKYSTRIPGVCLDEIAIGIGSKNCRIQTILLEKNVEPPSSISRIQWLDLSDWREYYSQGGTIWEHWIEKQGDELCNIIENPYNLKKVGEITKLELVLCPLLPEIKLRALLKEHFVQREWLISEVEKWRCKERASNVFCLVGGPGTGKSMFAAFLSNYMINCAAIYFFEWNNVESYDTTSFLKSLMFQLACNVSDYRSQLMLIIDEYKEEGAAYELFRRFIQQPLEKLIDGGREDCIIVIDALDEVGRAKQEEFLSLISYIIDNTPQWVKWIITSRPEEKIWEKINKYNPYCFDVHRSMINEELIEYMGMFIDNKDERISLATKCEGSFLYAKELIDLYKDGRRSIELLATLPSGISTMYFSSFERLFASFDEYTNYYRGLLEVVICSQEPISVKDISNLLNEKVYVVLSMVARMAGYIYLDEVKGEQVVSIKHKSFLDWIICNSAGKYRVDVHSGHVIYANYFLESIDHDISLYMVKYGYMHVKFSNIWNELSNDIQKKIYECCIENAQKYGLLKYEKMYIDRYRDECIDEIACDIYYLQYSLHAYGECSRELADQILEHSNNEKDDLRKYKMRETVAIAYFYMGLDALSLEILTEERENYSMSFWKNEEVLATYNHAISLPAHDMDLNELVVISSAESAKLYKKEKKLYDYYISLINNFDAYMGCGNLLEAEKIAKKVFLLNEETYFIHVDDILKICYANLLSEQGRIMEALQYYEEGLAIAKEIQSWDYIYGSIWRELAIAKFGDKSCFERLLFFRKKAEEEKYGYLVSLASCFYLICAYMLDGYLETEVKTSYDIVKRSGLPGHLLQSKIICLINEWNIFDEQAEHKEVFELLEKCQGVKGYPEIVKKYYEVFLKKKKLYNSDVLDKWICKYVSSVEKYKSDYSIGCIDDVPETPYVNIWTCTNCEAKCCYDGVYLLPEEERRIQDFVEKYSVFFSALPQDYIVNGTWPGMENIRKTAVREYNYTCDDFPKHFTRTRCVFGGEGGECLLQKVATEQQLHPWYAKPRACWSFPLRGIRDGKIIPPPEINEPDPDSIGEEYPGYVTFLPCGKAVENGNSWKNIMKNEIEYYDYLQRKKDINT